jgi:hypothetical protein
MLSLLIEAQVLAYAIFKIMPDKDHDDHNRYE